MDAAANREIELKFLVVDNALVKVESLPELKAALAGARRARLESTYFDTPDHDLSKKGFGIRIRKSGDRFVQTIKRDTASLIARREWEKEIDSPALDLGHIETTPLAELVEKKKLFGSLQPVFTVEVERRTFSLEASGADIEAVIDDGLIHAGDASLVIQELELELKQGDQDALLELARSLAADAPLRLCLLSKAERGFLLAAGVWGRSAKGCDPRLSADMTCREAFQEIARTCLHDLMLNSEALGTDDVVEGVHQARVATRRFRAALTLFKPMIADDAFEDLSAELKWIAGLLGTARDLDVMLLEGPPQGSTSEDAALSDDIAARRETAHQAVRDGFASPRYRVFLVDLVAWIEAGAWQVENAETAETGIVDFATKRLRKRRRRLVGAGKDLASLDPTARHRVRIEAKKLRYMAEFFWDVREVAERRKPYKALVEALQDLQEALGEMHDIEVRDAFLTGEHVPGQSDGRGEVAAGYVVAAATDTSRQLARAIDAYERLADANPF